MLQKIQFKNSSPKSGIEPRTSREEFVENTGPTSLSDHVKDGKSRSKAKKRHENTHMFLSDFFVSYFVSGRGRVDEFI